MIYPSARAVFAAAAMAVPALAIALALPGLWYAGLVGVVFVIALTIVDAMTTTPARLVASEVEVPAAAYVGQRVAITLGGRTASAQAVVEHDAHLVDEAPLAFVAVRRGRAAIDALWQRWPGRFGLAWRQRRVALDRHIAILPDIRPARVEALRLFRRNANFGETQQRDPGAGGEFQALTDFRTGMDRRAIDWKASARHGGLIAKEHRIERNNDLVFAIDAGRLMCEPVDGVPKIDRAVSAALTAAFVALKLGDKVALFGFDARPRIASGAVAGIGAFARFQALAAELDYSTAETNFTFGLTTLASGLKRRSMIIVFTDFVDTTSAETMLTVVGRLTATHLVVFVLMRDAELEQLAASPPTTVDDVSRAVIAAAMLRERRIVVARLQRLGVHIVEAAFDRLGTDLVNAYLGLKRQNAL